MAGGPAQEARDMLPPNGSPNALRMATRGVHAESAGLTGERELDARDGVEHEECAVSEPPMRPEDSRARVMSTANCACKLILSGLCGGKGMTLCIGSDGFGLMAGPPK